MTSAETEEKQPTVLEQMGGVSGMLYSSLPVVVFVIVNFAAKNLMAAIISALAAAVVIGVVLAIRKGTIQPAISAVFGVGIAAFIAYKTGEA
jgi:VIT1/CCC1 family predicted Fe2+/Mn2+ transporter